MTDWNPIQYEKFIKSRTIPAKDLIARIDSKPTTVFDLGCGPGNSTKALCNAFGDAEIVGVDFSENMVNKAKENYPYLKFFQFNAETDFDTLHQKYDLIFSNACIQWVSNHKALIPKMMDSLNKNGLLAVQIPLQNQHPVHQILKNLAKSDKWKTEFQTETKYNILTKSEYFDILSEVSDDFEIWETIYCHAMPSHESIIEWYESTGMRPYLDQLTSDKQIEFKNDVLTQIKAKYPSQRNGEIMFQFPRLFFTARKPQ